ncbi:MAG TPA: AAA family ATPase [Bacteroidales bacterium]|nr:AAA family ATPase [Bacteroidales bacterium]
MIILGITGTLGSGKGTVVTYLAETRGFVHFSVREYIARRLHHDNIPVNRDTLTAKANELRAINGPAYIIEELYKEAEALKKNCIIESIRTPGEIAVLRSKPYFFLLAVDADSRKRYDRIRLRNSETDQVTFDTFLSNEQREMYSTDPNNQNLSECIRQADVVIFNNGDLEELYAQTEKFLSVVLKRDQQ